MNIILINIKNSHINFSFISSGRCNLLCVCNELYFLNDFPHLQHICHYELMIPVKHIFMCTIYENYKFDILTLNG
ncbi:hypothetical protein V1477_014639 [Vespula maculifrons]|uniref:Uncharacterized protein n=1 Tax=Vespula maculifrons TaxID=7453 RepID=A0ABD2BI28_VESMC